MSRHRSTVFSLLLMAAVAAMLACPHRAAAQQYYANRHKGHRIFMWIGGGYSRLDLHLSSIPTLGHAGGCLGGGYGYSLSENIAVNAGVEYALLGSATKPAGFTVERPIFDTEDDFLTILYSFSRYAERQRAHSINIMPVSVEYADGWFYCAAGTKVGLLVSANAVTAADAELKGDYEKYRGTFQEIPYLPKISVRTANSISLRVNLMASAEVGVNIAGSSSTKKSDPLRIALFCDYGLSNISKASGSKRVRYDDEVVPSMVNFNSLTDSDANRITSLLVGLKLTVYFKSSKTKRVYPCFCPYP